MEGTLCLVESPRVSLGLTEDEKWMIGKHTIKSRNVDSHGSSRIRSGVWPHRCARSNLNCFGRRHQSNPRRNQLVPPPTTGRPFCSFLFTSLPRNYEQMHFLSRIAEKYCQSLGRREISAKDTMKSGRARWLLRSAAVSAVRENSQPAAKAQQSALCSEARAVFAVILPNSRSAAELISLAAFDDPQFRNVDDGGPRRRV